MNLRYCCNCMNELNGEAKICPKCGFDSSMYVQPDEALPCGTVLHDRYYVGRMIGQGGFGLTYIGYDNTLGASVCIKEYFPAGGAMRGHDGSTRVYWSAGSTGAALKQGRETFFAEAKKAAKVRSLVSVVNVFDAFYENDTAYIVMEYIKGVTLKDYLKKRGTVMDTEECLSFLLPVIRDLKEVHENGIVHRDISPDNLMVDEKGKVKLLDLGAAKDLSKGTEQSTLLITKKGFSPPEQHREGMSIGPWTDVYAMCATIYWCMTGKMLPDVMDRLSDDTLEFPKGMPAAMKEVLAHGLKTKVAERIQDMGELERELEAALEVTRNPGEPESTEQPPETPKKQPEEPKKKPDQVEQPHLEVTRQPEVRKQPLEEQLDELKNRSEETGTNQPPIKTLLIIATALILVLAAWGMTRWWPKSTSGGAAKEVVTVTEEQEDGQKEQQESANTGIIEEQVADEGSTSGIAAKEREDEKSDPELAALSNTLSKDKFKEWADKDKFKEWADIPVEEVEFRNTLEGAPSDAEDLSEAGDRGVLGWKDGNKLYIAGEGGVRAPRDCSELFSDRAQHRGDWSKLASVKNAEFFDVSNVVSLSGMFSGCNSLTTIDVSKWDTSNVVWFSGMFSYCNSLTTIDVSEWDTSNSKELNGIFIQCNSLITIDVSKWDTSNAKYLNGIFIDCNSLTTIDVSKWDTSNVTDMSSMFKGCRSLTSIDVSKWDTSNVTDMGYMFDGCRSLTSIDVGKWDTSNVTDMSNMFNGGNSLTSIDVSKWDTSNVTDMRNMFKWCSNLTELDVGKWDTPNVTNMAYMFYGCSNLTELDVGKWDTSNVTYMSHMFNGCSNLIDLDVSTWDTSSVKYKYDMFKGTKWEDDPPF